MYAVPPVIDNTGGKVNNLGYGALNLNAGATGLTGRGC